MFAANRSPLSFAVCCLHPFGGPEVPLKAGDAIATRHAIVEVITPHSFAVQLDDGTMTIAAYESETLNLLGRPEASDAVREAIQAAREGRLTRRTY